MHEVSKAEFYEWCNPRDVTGRVYKAASGDYVTDISIRGGARDVARIIWPATYGEPNRYYIRD